MTTASAHICSVPGEFQPSTQTLPNRKHVQNKRKRYKYIHTSMTAAAAIHFCVNTRRQKCSFRLGFSLLCFIYFTLQHCINIWKHKGIRKRMRGKERIERKTNRRKTQHSQSELKTTILIYLKFQRRFFGIFR